MIDTPQGIPSQIIDLAEKKVEQARGAFLGFIGAAQKVDGAGAKLVSVGPPNRYEEVVSHPTVILWACRPCVDARGLARSSLDRRVKLGGMNEFHAGAKQSDSKVVAF
jgi:hypothetical protein